MKSPFPGMDPYLEPHWLDVHTKLVTYAADALDDHLPADLIASTQERVAVEAQDAANHVFGPDVMIFEPPADALIEVEGPSAGGVAAPYRLLAQIEPIIERFIKVIEAGTERLVTVIEFVSPTNKRGEGLHVFRSKRGELLASGVNFVEIDLVRSGDWQALLRPHRCARKGISAYRATMRVTRDPAAVYLHPIRLQEKLPDIAIPLREKDPELRLDLQPLVDRAYAKGRYQQRLNYAKPCQPPLEGEDAAWAQELLKNWRS